MAQDDIQGQVVDASGNPVEGAIVELTKSYQSSPTDEEVVRRTTTDSSGNYIFDYHPDGDGSTQEWHVSCYNYDGTAYVNSENNPGVTADLSAAAIPDSGVLYYSYEDDTDTSTATDQWNSNDATLNGPVYSTTSHVGTYGLDFDGIDDDGSIPVGQGLFDSGEFTIATWVRKDDTDTGNTNEAIFSYEGRTVGLSYNNVNNTGGFEMLINGDSVAIGDVNVGIQNYIHCVITFDGSDAEFYYNSTSQGTLSSSVNGGESTTTVGTGSGGTDKPANVTLDETKFYSKRLTNTEISNLYNMGSI